MTPGARVAAAIEILDEIGAGQPAEQALTRWARRSRFAGSKDRAAVRDHVFQALRCRRSFAALGGAETGRGLMIGALRAAGIDPSDLFTGDGHAPPPLTCTETTAGHSPRSAPEAFDLPDWIWDRFEASLGAETESAARELKARAPVMLRVNTKLSSVPQAIETLREDGVMANPSPIAESALEVVDGLRRVTASKAYHDGGIELQDGSSQAAMAHVPVPADGRVLDYCAGGGGKVLALAARAEATWFAHDADAGRMKDLPVRAARAKAQIAIVSTEQVRDLAPYDLILCDVPCSGSGTWRRTPEAKWRLTPARLEELQTMQADILSDAAALVSDAGCLAYSTCSILREENEVQVSRFLQCHNGWQLELEQRWPISRHGDGFFLALLRRV